MYDKVFDVLAVLTVLGVGFIAWAASVLVYTDDTAETPPRANVALVGRVTAITDNLHAPDVTRALEQKATKEAAKAIIDDVLTFKDFIESIDVSYYKKTYVGKFYITMYAATVEQCGNSLGITASGRKVTDDPTCHTVAVDPAVIPLGSYLIIEGYDGIIFRADDTGSAINGYDIDIFTTSEAESKTFNNQSGVKVWIIEN